MNASNNFPNDKDHNENEDFFSESLLFADGLDRVKGVRLWVVLELVCAIHADDLTLAKNSLVVVNCISWLCWEPPPPNVFAHEAFEVAPDIDWAAKLVF